MHFMQLEVSGQVINQELIRKRKAMSSSFDINVLETLELTC